MVDCVREWLVDFNTGKTEHVSFYCWNNSIAVYGNFGIGEKFPDEKSYLAGDHSSRCWGYLSLHCRVDVLTFSQLLKLSLRKF